MRLSRREALQLMGGAGTALFLGDVLRALAAAPAGDPKTEVKIADELLPHFDTQYLVVDIPEPLAGNVSKIEYTLPPSEISDGETPKIGGRELGALMIGDNNVWPNGTSAIVGLPSGEGSLNLQDPQCSTGEFPFNDLGKKLLVLDPVGNKPGFKIILSENDEGDPGEQLVIDKQYLDEHAIPVEMLAIDLASVNVDNAASKIESTLADIYTPDLQNHGALFVTSNYPHLVGQAIPNAGTFEISLQTPCDNLLNDRQLGVLLIPKSQLNTEPPQSITFSENDEGDPGLQLPINLADYLPGPDVYKVFLPLITNATP